MVAQNSGGTSFGADQTFTTLPLPPTVLTGLASSITQTTVTLNGSVNPNGASTTAWLEWGTTSAYGNQTPPRSLGSGTTSVSLSESLTNLLPNTSYHFRVVAQNSGGTSLGVDQTFTTSTSLLTLTFQTNLPGLTFLVDGQPYTSSQSFTWPLGSSHTLSLPSPQRDALGFEYVGIGWSDGGALTHTITPTTDTTYIGIFSARLLAPRGDSADFDGDGRTDLTVWRADTGQWYILGASNVVAFGVQGDIPTPGDYDGDGISDIAFYRPATGQWQVRLSGFGGMEYVYSWGEAGDLPVPGDYDGDQKTDYGVWRGVSGEWWISLSSGGQMMLKWGQWGDIPVPGDYDGDGRMDLGVFRPGSGEWWILSSSEGPLQVQGFGGVGDIPVVGDYDGDGRVEVAVWSSSSGRWRIRGAGGKVVERVWGVEGDVPVVGDYDGDGRVDLGIYRPGSGEWWILSSVGGYRRVLPVVVWGQSGDVPVSGFGGR